MNRRLLIASLCLVLPALCRASDEPAVAPPSAREMLRARLAEESEAGTGKPVPGSPAAAAPITETAKAIAEGTDKNPIVASAPGNATTSSSTAKTETKKEPATVLPKVEVKKNRITVLDQQLAKQDEMIAREKKNTKSSEMDKALLNDDKIARPLSIFGGESTQYRKQVANQRVALLEDEKDLLEAIAQAKTKAEKAELQQQLDALRAERRELEKAAR